MLIPCFGLPCVIRVYSLDGLLNVHPVHINYQQTRISDVAVFTAMADEIHVVGNAFIHPHQFAKVF